MNINITIVLGSIRPNFEIKSIVTKEINNNTNYHEHILPHQPLCSNPQWFSLDPRLMSPAHSPMDFNDRQTLNTPPYTGEVPLNNIYDNCMPKYEILKVSACAPNFC